jgi:hypothetical protein
MLKQLRLTNFRRFVAFSVRLGKGNILVGPNNSGKSSILDALRILESCLRHSKTRNPTILEIPGKGVLDGYEVPDSVLPFSLANVTNNLDSETAILEFYHENGAVASILMHPDRLTRFYIEKDGHRLTQSSKFRSAFPITIVNIPTLAPLEADEQFVADATEARNAPTRLASRVFRNTWLRRSKSEFDAFAADIESAWPGVTLRKPELTSDYPRRVQMFYREGTFESEVQWAGFGFQVWMLMHTHFTRAIGGNTILIIDEPDVYLHPELQRQLIYSIRKKFDQFLMATHSIELINEAESNELISVDAKLKSGRRVNSEMEFTNLYHYIGSGSNADFARIVRAKKVIFVEGRDGKLLRKMANRFGFDSLAKSQEVPIVQLGGFSEWKKATHAVWAFKDILKVEIKLFCIFDRDYRCHDEVTNFLEEIANQGMMCRVWLRKEIENYIFDPDLIYNALAKKQRGADDGSSVILTDVEEIFDQITDEMKHDVNSQMAADALRWARKCGSAEDDRTIIRKTSREFESSWKTRLGRMKLIPGKEALSELNGALETKKWPTITSTSLVDQMDAGKEYDDLKVTLQQLNDFCEAD